jgi:hypothetical protein
MKECMEITRIETRALYPSQQLETLRDKPGFFGPFRYKDTGEGYWERNVRLEHEYNTRIKNEQRTK